MAKQRRAMNAQGSQTTVLVANPGADVYGSDLQLLESVSAMTRAGWRVVVCVPERGPLVELLERRGADVVRKPFPVVRRGALCASGVLRFAGENARSLRVMRRVIRSTGADVIYVNTVTIPGWLLAARLTRTPSLCHVHEAENSDSRLVLTALYAPLLLANRLVLNGRAAWDVLGRVVKPVLNRSTVVFNGVPGPGDAPTPTSQGSGPFRLAVVGRLSPRKAPDVALDAVALLRQSGRDVRLDVCGSNFRGYEWYVARLRKRAQEPDLAGAVTFSGYQSPIWAVLERCHAVLAPSLGESFGNAVVEAQLAQRPVVATAVPGHLDTVADTRTGLLVPAGDARSMAEAVARLMDDPRLAEDLALQARHEALRQFSVERYNDEITAEVRSLATSAGAPSSSLSPARRRSEVRA